MSRSSVPLLDEIESSLGAKNNYNYNYSNYRNSAKTSSPKFKPNSSYEHGYPGPGLNMGSSSPDLLTGNTNDLNSDKPVIKSADFVDTESNRSSSPENFERSSRQSSVREKAKGGIANSRSHTDGDLKLLSGNGETYQSSADGRNSRPPKVRFFNSRTAIAGAIIGLLLVFYNSKNLNCIGALSFYDSKRSIGEVLFFNQFYWSDF